MNSHKEYDSHSLRALVDNKSEDPGVEYKAWMDMSQNADRAKLAKHLCALANYGGGWLVFGVNDDGTHSEPHPGDLSSFDQDEINGIFERYLTPHLHCSVHFVDSGITKKPYPIVRVPSHGQVPVCAKASGPIVKGVSVGVAQGTHYLRVAGPKSVPINNSTLWRDVIHRCVVNERQELLASIGRLFDRPESGTTSAGLSELLRIASENWNTNVPDKGWPVDPKENRMTFAFRFLNDGGQAVQAVSVDKLRDGLREASHAAESAYETGWTFFIQSGGDDRPRVVIHGDVEALEADMIADKGRFATVPTLWRVATDGQGFEVRPHPEDSHWIVSNASQRRKEWSAGTRFSPRLQVALMYQFVVFVRTLGGHFSRVTKVEIGIECKGLKGRYIDDTDPTYYSVRRSSVVSDRTIRVDASLESLAGDGAAAAAAQLAQPIFALFDGWDISPAYVRKVVG